MTLENIGKMTGLEVLEAIADNRIKHPSMARTLGFRLTEVDDRLYGLGTADMKSFFALAIAAASRRQRPPQL